MAAALRLRMDKSKPYSSIHGERGQDDPLFNVHFSQDGLLFDAHGFYVDGLFDDSNDRGGKLRALAEKRLKKLEAAALLPADADADDDDDDDIGAGSSVKPEATTADDVDLGAWLRGDANYLFGLVRDAMKKRYGVNIKDHKTAVETLVIDEKVVSESELSPAFKKLLGVEA